jgi:pimeloyl-ACP methyl ester carboxylesterase
MPNRRRSTSVSLHKEVHGAGDPILCLHGLGANIYSWRHFIAPFSQHYKLILVDFKGCGKSPKPLDTHYSIEEKVEDIYNLILEENLTNLTLVGNSLGGAIAMLVAIQLGKQHADRVSKLILIDSAGDKGNLPPHFKLLRSPLGTSIIYLAPSKLAALTTLRMCYHDRKKITKDQVNAYAQPLANRGGRHALLHTVRQCIPANADELTAQISTINVPTLILWGREDKVIPLRVGRLLHQLIPNSTLEVIEHCGHIPQEEKPDETISLISQFMTVNRSTDQFLSA